METLLTGHIVHEVETERCGLESRDVSIDCLPADAMHVALEIIDECKPGFTGK